MKISNKKITIITILCFAFAFTATVAYAALTLNATTISSDGSLTLTPATNVIISNGNLGIGTATPINDLTVISSTNDTPTFFSRLTDSTDLTAGYIWVESNNPSTIANAFSNIAFTGYRNSDANGAIAYASINGIFADHAAVNGDIAFITRNNNNPGERMRILSNGNVGIGTASPNPNAILDVTSTTKAFMPPRMTTVQRNAIASPTAGMVIYNTTTNKLNVYTTTWEAVTSS